MKYIVIFFALIAFSTATSYGQCPERSSFQVVVENNHTQSATILLTIPETTSPIAWDLKLYSEKANAFVQTRQDVASNQVSFDSLEEGGYLLIVTSDQGCEFSLGNPEDIFESIMVYTR